MSPPIDLNALILPADLSADQIETEARRIYFEDLALNPPVTPQQSGLQNLPIRITRTEGAFQKIFGKTEGWQGFHHQKTGILCIERMRRAPWIRPVLELQVAKTKIYVNNHSMKPREYGSSPRPSKKNRTYVTVDSKLMYFLSLVYIDEQLIGPLLPGIARPIRQALVLSTAFSPDGQWLREALKKDNTVCLNR